MTRAYLAAIGASVALIAAALIAFGAAVPPVEAPASPTFHIPECETEDACAVKFNGHWRLRECIGACDDDRDHPPFQRVYLP